MLGASVPKLFQLPVKYEHLNFNPIERSCYPVRIVSVSSIVSCVLFDRTVDSRLYQKAPRNRFPGKVTNYFTTSSPMYLRPFRNQYPDHDFTLISDAIRAFFPVDQPKRLTSKTVSSSRGFKKMGKIVNKEFIDQNAYRDKWGKLTSNLKKVFKKAVHGFPDLSGGGFFGEVIFEEDKKPDFIRQKSLRFYISIIGPFFSIHGVDSSIAILEIESRVKDFNKGKFAATHAITISPAFEYLEVFKKLEHELRAFFPGYLFVPYDIGMSTMKNISIADELRETRSMDTVYEALYGRAAVHECLTRGDRSYGRNDWVKPLNKKEKALIDLISKHVKAASTDITIHKVWKLHESKRLDTFKVSGNLMFGMDLIDVIDLTDKSKLIMMSKERGAPSSGRYRIKNEVIEINSNYSFRIADLSKVSLTLHLILNFEHKDVSIKGEVLQMRFIQMKKLD